MFWIFVRIASSNEYPKNMSCEEIRRKRALFTDNSAAFMDSLQHKFILTATSLGTNDIDVTRVHYIIEITGEIPIFS